MKQRFFILSVFVGLFALTMSSCTYIYNIQIDSLEQNVVKIEDSNNTLSQEEREAAIQECGQKLEKISRKNRNYSPEQQVRIANLTERLEELKAQK